ncbi:transcriptional elongation regulator MINIYO [Phalaenopsis equestris]|uniref:transcriptional elongation regulator MINIYO n=1 Tax=Phalaenopsis equestris TaxID=78828 RepID=UPI0009E5066E|nr:transcriptional elongation regulator MINIYO [Phalaenopsis equestris]
MEPERSVKNPPVSRKPKAVYFSSTKPQSEEIHATNGLVGSIIEKGFSSSSSSSSNPPNPSIISYPQPTVLPFPVARHRSHGPHWNPLHVEPEFEEEDDMDETDYSAFASPIKRKEKKGLDFSRWRNFVPQSDYGFSKHSEENNKILATKNLPCREAFEEVVQGSSEPLVAVKRAKASSHMVDDEYGTQLSQSNSAGLPAVATGKLDNNGGDTEMLMSNKEGFGSTMEDIHAENLARLKQMSQEEIADAQAEIIGKMNPAMVAMLRKRGQEKLGNRKVVASGHEKGVHEMIESDEISGKDNVAGGSPSQGVKSTGMAAEHADWVSSEQVNSNSWKIWSERVEKVRDLRFSLEGDVLDVDSYLVPSGCKQEGAQPDVENVAERDFLRTEGDPAALGYSIKEVIALIRSMVPAQRALALKLLDSILNKAQFNLLNDKGWLDAKNDTASNHVDWQAIWAYALGPEPQLVLSLRIALDDNHHSVVLACAKVIQSILSCDMNEGFFNVAEKVPAIQRVLCTAPIFRSRAEIDSSFLHGGFWKYSTKPSNIIQSNIDNDDEGVGEHTIQDDIVVAGQDIAAGLVRMGVLPRICYLLEMEPIPALVECLLSVLIGLARHSPYCANAVFQCPRLIQNIVNISTMQGMMELLCQIKAITLLKVLSQMDKRLCLNFVKSGVFQQVMWHWYRNLNTIDQWVESGKEHCKLTSSLMIEQLRLWKVCVSYGYCVSYFADFFPNLCRWLSRPTFNKLLEFSVLDEFAHVVREAYVVLGALAELLPCLHSTDQLIKRDTDHGDDFVETWSWSHVVPMVNFAISWLSLNDIPYVSSMTRCFEENDIYNSSSSSIIWVISAVLHMFCCVFGKMSLRRADDENNSTSLPWLPEFVPKVGIEIVKNGFLCLKEGKGCSFIERLCYLRHQDDFDMSFSSLCCLHGLIKLTSLIDDCIQRARNACDIQLHTESSFDIEEGKVIAEGMIKWGRDDLTGVLDAFGSLVSAEWPMVQYLEAFGRGGPAPGVGVGWGSPCGGFWSLTVLRAQEDARLVLELLENFPIVLEIHLASIESMNPLVLESPNPTNHVLHRINCVLAICLVAGPAGRDIVEAAFKVLFQPPVLKYLGLFLHRFLQLDKRLKSFKWQYEDKDYLLFSKILNSHFRERWLSFKTKSSGDAAEHTKKHELSRKTALLETIHEDQENEEILKLSSKDTVFSSFCIEWIRQRLPVPEHWFLSALCGIGELKNFDSNSSNELEAAKIGLFFLLCLEASSLTVVSDQKSPIFNVSLVWKLHALSMSLHANMAVLEDERTRDVFESLQELYGKQLDKSRHKAEHKFSDSSSNLSETRGGICSEILSFQSQINDSYSTFVEDLIGQFGAVSYGDIIFGRQIAIYLHRCVDFPIRLSTWNVLSNSYLLELLPPLEMCFSEADGYLEPPEDKAQILEAYAKAWTSGSLEKAFTRRSLGFSLALHHLHSLIFESVSPDTLKLRNKLAKSLLRSHSHKHRNFGMLLHLVKYKLPIPEDPLHGFELIRRFDLLVEICERNSSLIAVVDHLKSVL